MPPGGIEKTINPPAVRIDNNIIMPNPEKARKNRG